MPTYFARELKKKLESLGIDTSRDDIVERGYNKPVYSKNYQKQESVLSAFGDSDRQAEALPGLHTYSRASNNARILENMFLGMQAENDIANKLYWTISDRFVSIANDSNYHNEYMNFIERETYSKKAYSSKSISKIRDSIKKNNPIRQWLWERAINEIGSDPELSGQANVSSLRRALIDKVPNIRVPQDIKEIKPEPIIADDDKTNLKHSVVDNRGEYIDPISGRTIPYDRAEQSAVADTVKPQDIIDQKVDKKGNTVGNYFIGSLLSTVRNLFTAGTLTPEEQEKIKGSRGKAENFTAAERFMVNAMTKGAKNMAKRGGGKSLMPLVDAVDIGSMSKQAEDYLLSAGYKIEQMEKPFYERADIENKPWYTQVFAKGVGAIPSLAVVYSAGPVGIGALTISSMKTNTEDISRRQKAGEEISDAASIAYVLGNAAIDTASYVMFSKLGQPFDPANPTTLSKLLGSIMGSSGSKALSATLNTTPAMSVVTKEFAKIIAKAGTINLSNYVLSGLLSKISVDKDKVLLGFNKDELITLTGALAAFGTGAVKGVFTGITRFAHHKEFLKQYAKLTNKSIDNISYAEIREFFSRFYDLAQKHSADYAEATAGGLQKITKGNGITDTGAKYVPQATDTAFSGPFDASIAETGAAVKQAATISQQAPAQVKSPQSLPQEQKQELIDNTIKDVGAAEEAKPAETVTKETYVSNNAEPIAVGKELRSSISGKDYVNTQVNVVNLSDITPSMDAGGVAIEGYNKKFQPRDTERASSRIFIDDIARDLNPDKYFEKETIQNGIPVVDKDGMVIVGNHRVAALLRAKQQYPEKYEEYKQAAIVNAQELGLNPDTLQGDFIVTRLLPEGADGQNIADKSNIAEQRDMSAAEKARRDANYIDAELLDAFVATENGSILTRENERFRNLFLGKVLGGRTDDFMDKDGNYSIEGINRMNNAIFYKAYGDTSISALAAESQDHNYKRIITAMRNVAPRIVELDRSIESGTAYEINMKDLVVKSAERYMQMKNNKEDIHLFASNIEMGDTPEIVRAKQMLYLMSENAGSYQRLTDMYNDLLDAVGLAGNPKQQDMFGPRNVSVDDIIEASVRRYVEKKRGLSNETIEEKPPLLQREDSAVSAGQDARKGPAEVQAESKQKANKQVSDKGYAEAVGEVSARQDTTGRTGIVAPGFASTQTQSPAQPHKISNYQGPKNDAVRKTFDESKRPPKGQKPSKIETTMDFIRKTFFRASVPEVGFDEGQVRSNVVRLRKKYDIASQLAYESIKGIYNPIDGEYKTAMDYAVFLPDMIEDINNGLYKDASELPFPFDSFQEVYDEYDRLQTLIDDPSDSTIKNALEARQKIFDANRKAIMDLGNELGIDFSGFFTRNDYVHHAIIDFMVQGESDPKARGGVNSILRARDGSVRAYITDAAMADYIALQKMADMTHKLEVLVDIKDRDITDKLQKDSAGNLIIPDGYREVDSTIVGFTFPAEMLKNQAVAVAKLAIDVAGIDPDSDVAMRILAEAKKTQRNAHYVIPSDVADAYDSLNAPKSVGGAIGAIDKVYGKAMGTWKRYQLVHPRRAFRFTLRNAISDTAKVFGFEPKVLTKYTVNAVRDLTKYYKGQGASESLIEYIKAGGMSSGLVNIELGDTKDLDKLNIYNKDGTMKTGDQLKEMMGTPLNVLEKFYDWREQILRYAGFTYYMDKGLDPVTNQPVNGEYRASRPAEIKSMKNRRDIAYKMSNDMVGAYDDVSPATQFMSKRVSPFIRYHATTNTAYFRGLKNTFYQNPDVIMSAGQKAARAAKGTGKAAASTVWRLGKFVLAMTAWTAAQQIWNRGIMKEADDNVPDYARNQGHITLGMINGKVYYVSDTDPLRTALDWVGLGPQTAKDMGDVLSGRITPGALIKHILTAPYEQLTESVAPFITPVFETKLGRKMFTGQYIRDPVEYVAELFQAGPMYRALAGKPQKDGKFDWNIMSFQKAYEGESQFWEIYTLMNKYLVSVGKPETVAYPPSKEAKSMALYEFRTAIRYRDQVAAEKYLIQYFLAGGDIKGIETSARSMNPIQSLKKDEREPFIESLTGHDKEMYDKGMEFYSWYADDMVRFAKYNQEKAEDAAAALAAEEAAKKNKRR